MNTVYARIVHTGAPEKVVASMTFAEKTINESEKVDGMTQAKGWVAQEVRKCSAFRGEIYMLELVCFPPPPPPLPPVIWKSPSEVK